MMFKDGGPAFPTRGKYLEEHPEEGWMPLGLPGMTLRDYFAAQASSGAADVLCDQITPCEPMETYDPVQHLAEAKRHAIQHAMMAYVYADAMLKARTEQG